VPTQVDFLGVFMGEGRLASNSFTPVLEPAAATLDPGLHLGGRHYGAGQMCSVSFPKLIVPAALHGSEDLQKGGGEPL